MCLINIAVTSSALITWQTLAVMVNEASPSPRFLGFVNGVATTTSMASRLFGPIVAGAAISYIGGGGNVGFKNSHFSAVNATDIGYVMKLEDIIILNASNSAETVFDTRNVSGFFIHEGQITNKSRKDRRRIDANFSDIVDWTKNKRDEIWREENKRRGGEGVEVLGLSEIIDENVAVERRDATAAVLKPTVTERRSSFIGRGKALKEDDNEDETMLSSSQENENHFNGGGKSCETILREGERSTESLVDFFREDFVFLLFASCFAIVGIVLMMLSDV